METNQIKKFAQEARTMLQRGVRNRLLALGFDSNGHIAEKDMPVCGADHVVFMGRVIGDVSFYRKWMSLYERLQDKGVQYVCEEAAYTWFNRLMAIRILVKNGFADPVLEYQSDALRIPRIVTDARRGVLPQMSEADRELLMELLEDDTKTTEQFAVLIVSYCKHQPILSAGFGAVTDYTELLLPANILTEGGLVDMLNHTAFISDEDYRQSELIGWLYQFYISEKKDEVFASKEKVKAEDIPAATQIFTPNWIVKYMVQNTLGRIYLDNNPYAMDIKDRMAYLVQSDSPAPEASVFRYDDIHALTVADLACGSGHILNEAFDLLYTIYIEEGYNRRRAIEEIFRYNLLGIDLDLRAKQLAMFALLMKACQRDPSFLDAHCLPRVLDMGVATDVRRLNAKSGVVSLLTEFFAGAGKQLIAETMDALALMEQADNLGSIMRFTLSDTTRTAIALRMEEWRERGTDNEDMQTLLAAFEVILALTDKYAALIANPPYMGRGNMNSTLTAYLDKNYPIAKQDLFATFMQMMIERTQDKGRCAFITMESWMFLSSFEKLRHYIIDNYYISSLGHFGWHIIGIAFGTAMTVIEKNKDYGRIGEYSYLTIDDIDKSKNVPFVFPKKDNGRFAHVSQQNFEKIPGCPIGYWVSERMIECFTSGASLSKYGISDGQNITGNNDKYLRNIWEVSIKQAGKGNKWVPIAKGGSFRRWYGNIEDVINWSGEARLEYKNNPVARIQDEYLWYRVGITWNLISSGNFGTGFRYLSEEYLFNKAAPTVIMKEEYLNYTNYILAFLNTHVVFAIMKLMNPTFNTNIAEVFSLKLRLSNKEQVDGFVSQNISISKSDWDAHETSWDFQENELVRLSKEQGEESHRLSDLMDAYREHWTEQFLQLHANEEELNRQFIEIYGLEDELTPDVPLEEITILQQGEISIENGQIIWHDDVLVKQFISYAVGCMMGRYRLDKPGLHIANPNPTEEEVCTYTYNGQDFTTDEDGIVPLMTRDCPFPDNASERFKQFLKVALGEDALTGNLNFVEAALGKDIESYFVKDFWKDHLARYQRRPIYWLFSSKKGAFQCIAYMHRMNPYTVEQIRNKYLLPHMEYLGDRITEMESRAAALTTKERKLLEKFRKDLDECREYHDRLHEVADRQIAFDLDDGVVVNYAKFGDVLRSIK